MSGQQGEESAARGHTVPTSGNVTQHLHSLDETAALQQCWQVSLRLNTRTWSTDRIQKSYLTRINRWVHQGDITHMLLAHEPSLDSCIVVHARDAHGWTISQDEPRPACLQLPCHLCISYSTSPKASNCQQLPLDGLNPGKHRPGAA